MNEIWTRIKNEPVLVSTFVGSVIALLVAFGLEIDAEQKAAIIGVVASVLAIITRQSVTPFKG